MPVGSWVGFLVLFPSSDVPLFVIADLPLTCIPTPHQIGSSQKASTSVMMKRRMHLEVEREKEGSRYCKRLLVKYSLPYFLTCNV